jgi:hypothetical protein
MHEISTSVQNIKFSLQFLINSERCLGSSETTALLFCKTQWTGHNSPPYLLSPNALVQCFFSAHDTRRCLSFHSDILDSLGIVDCSVGVQAGPAQTSLGTSEAQAGFW